MSGKKKWSRIDSIIFYKILSEFLGKLALKKSLISRLSHF